MAPRAKRRQKRTAAVMILFALFLVLLLGLIAFAVDIGVIVLTRTQLQSSADAAAMAGASQMGQGTAAVRASAREYAAYHLAGGAAVQLSDADIELGIWDATRRVFTPNSSGANAVRVTARRDNSNANGQMPLFFGRIFGQGSFAQSASAVAMTNPRDICFVVDLSGSMNDDTEPCWATPAINSTFGPLGFPVIGNSVMQDLYNDFGFGAFPGLSQSVGSLLGVANNANTYAVLTSDVGPLTSAAIPKSYRITDKDSESQRKVKAYSWLIDNQIALLMPNAKPTPSSQSNYDYWAEYLDYLMRSVTIKPSSSGSSGGSSGSSGGSGGSSGGSKGNSGGSSGSGGGSSGGGTKKPGVGQLRRHADDALWALLERGSAERVAEQPWQRNDLTLVGAGADLWPSWIAARGALAATAGTPPDNRGTIPPSQNSERITGMNNPNTSTFPKASNTNSYRQMIGYRTYVQFMMDKGRDLQVGGQYVPLSLNSKNCPMHSETTAGGNFKFPPREQPTHASRRSLISAIEIVRQQNTSIPDPKQRDWVSVVSFDTMTGGGPIVQRSLTSDYTAAMEACTQIQAVGDRGASTATESGMIKAQEHIRPTSEGGSGRENTTKVVVLLTDGVPNLYQSSNATINSFVGANPSADFYNDGSYWYDAPLMQASKMKSDHWQIYPVGVGLGTDYSFMDRISRMGGTADKNGQAPRGTGNPAQYEQVLTDIFRRIITSPLARLVQ